MIIRTFRKSDTPAVTELWLEVFPDNPRHSTPAINIAKKLSLQRELFFVAEDEGQIAGTIMAGYDGHRGWLYTLAVNPRLRRKGIGAALVRHAESALREMGCAKINLQVRTRNAGVVAFYQKLGYAVEEIISMGKRIMEIEEQSRG
jgi:ribosomal protein S18 acetylase RimI-like enzyme